MNNPDRDESLHVKVGIEMYKRNRPQLSNDDITQMIDNAVDAELNFLKNTFEQFPELKHYIKSMGEDLKSKLISM